MYHYVYKVIHIETKQFYIGSRSSKVHPTLDSYLGSMKTWKPDKTKLKKEIIKDDFNCREDAIKFEAEEITKFIHNPLNENYHVPNKGYHTVGLVTVKDVNGQISTVSINDPAYLNGTLVGATKGFVCVKDSYGNKSFVSTQDSRYINDELHAESTGYLYVKDSNDNVIRVRKDDEKYKSGEYWSIWKNTVTVIDADGKCFRVAKNDPRYISGELKFSLSNRVFDEYTRQKLSERAKENIGIKNSQFGTMWIYNVLLKTNKKIKKNSEVPIGWSVGRKIFFK
ncbi:MAG: hypothetical protein M0R51_06595 [Clostridia bacterium]|jgi:hypothetical protein|nr:hypothetical protein [Clostridia bacterium]